ncbi:O-antigen ligase domain-containing protein [Candidatus Parcubacteria bacterium]|nr:MAG: O-antigen ligase domain-containing protein [Candidatus Parcubacteria bacterium]
MNKLLLAIYFTLCLIFSTIISPQIVPRLSVGGASVSLTDFLFIFFAGSIFVSRLTNKKEIVPVRPYPATLMVIFMVVGLIGFFNGIFSKDVGMNLAVREGRNFFLYFVYFIYLGLSLDEKNVKRIVSIVLVLAGLTSLFSILEASGAVDRLGFISGKVMTLTTGGEEMAGVTRVSLPGVSVINFAFFILFFQLSQKISALRLSLMALISLGFFLSFNRGAWLSTILAIFTVFFFLPPSLKKHVAIKGFIIFFLGLLLFVGGLTGIMGNRVKAYLDAGTDRFATMTFAGMQEDRSFMGRFEESRLLLEKLENRPVFGFGLGALTQRVKWGKDDEKESLRSYETGYAHNGYVYLTYKLGIVGLLSFLLLFAHFSINSLKKVKQLKNPGIGAVYAASIGFVISIVPHSLVNPRNMEGKWIIIIASAMALSHLCLSVDAMQSRKLSKEG